MRQTLSVSVFVNFDLSFQPSDNLYTMLVRLCLLQFITKTYLSKNVNVWGELRANLLPTVDAGLQQERQSLLPLPLQWRWNRPEPSRGPIVFVGFLCPSGIVKKG
jgi:hypothetical protein